MWQKRYNYELYETFNEPNIVTYIKVNRLAWAGHLVCMNDRTLKKILIVSFLKGYSTPNQTE
jgi:hypothetical protein